MAKATPETAIVRRWERYTERCSNAIRPVTVGVTIGPRVTGTSRLRGCDVAVLTPKKRGVDVYKPRGCKKRQNVNRN